MRKSLLFLALLFSCTNLLAQQVQVRGRIVNAEDKTPVIGANVLIKGSYTGTTTDVEGNYTISAKPSDALTFSALGYKSQEAVIGTKTQIDIILEPDITALDEVIVVGYGTQKKSVLTAAISSLKADDFKDATPTRIEDILQGRVSGVQITKTSGQPGAGSQVRIRGIGTINNSNPLYIVDGMPVGGGIDYLNPSDIASIEVLKDAASAAIYGARGANGVILVTTKTGSSNKKTSVTADYSYGIQNPWKYLKVLDQYQYQTLVNEAYFNAGLDPLYSSVRPGTKGTDWQKEVFNRNAPMMNAQVGVSGGSEKVSYFFSFGYMDQEGIVGGNFDRSNYNRLNIRTNNTYTLFDESSKRRFLNKFTVGINAGYTRIKSSGIATNSEFGSPLGSAIMLSPLVPVYATNPQEVLDLHPTAVRNKNTGQVYAIPGNDFGEIVNPLADLSLPGGRSNTDKLVATVWGELQLFDELKFKSSFGSDLAFWGDDGWTPSYYLSKTNFREKSDVWSSMNRGYTWLWENTLSYRKTIAEKHTITALVGLSAQKYTNRWLWGKNYDLQEEDPRKANINFAQGTIEVQEANGGSGHSTLASYFGRVGYNYDDKYLAEFTLRRDGSSNFGPLNKWAIFPSVSVGWVLTRESFMRGATNVINFLKLRASWGRNGNESIGQYLYTTTIAGNNNYVFGSGANENIAFGAKPNGISNPNLKWEESEQTDIGLDVHLFKSALTLSIDWFRKSTNGMLMTVPLPSYVGDSSPMGNVGSMVNKGVEIDLNYKLAVRDFHFGVSANATYLRNQLINIGNDTGYINYASLQGMTGGTYVRGENGLPFPFFYGHKTNGIFQNWAEVNSYINKDGKLIQPDAQPGDVRFVDLDNSGAIDDGDRTMLGKGMPDWTFSLNLNFEWKGVDFSCFFQGVTGNDIFDAVRRVDLPLLNQPGYMWGRWHGEGTSNSIPRMAIGDANLNWRPSDLYVQDGKYLRLKTLQIGYTLPAKITRHVRIERLRFYFSAENLFTWTKYRGFDPEISDGGMNVGIDKGNYPQSRNFIWGVNLAF